MSKSLPSNINKFIDNTGGYYTYDPAFEYISAHYNWHHKYSKYSCNIFIDRQKVLKEVKDILSRRLTRLFEVCERSKAILMIYDNPPWRKHMIINNQFYQLTQTQVILKAAAKVFMKPVIVTNLDKLLKPNGCDQVCEIMKRISI